MKTKNWIEEKEGTSQANSKQEETEKGKFCGRTYNEEVPFTQVNFQTFQNILDQRNQLLTGVKSSNNLI